MNGLPTVLNVFLAALVSSAGALYDRSADVIDLTASNFDRRVVDSEEVWIVEFYAPWCGHCKALAPEYSKAAAALKGVVKVGAVDADQHKSLGGQYGVRGFPTIKIFSSNKKSPQDYQGQRTANGLIDAAFKELRKLVDMRLGGKRPGKEDGKKKADDKDVIELTDENFKETVLDSQDMWLVEFYAPWCGHCKNLAPHWAEAATALKGKMKLGALDATVHTVTAGRYGIQGFPTIKFFPGGKKDGSAEDYDGGRTASDIISWGTEKSAESAPAPDVVQLTSESGIKDACENQQLCIISILPHLLDCQSSCRNDYLDTLRKLGEKFKRNRWGWIWAEAMAQPELEDALGIGGFGYPAMAALNSRKMKYSLLRGSFSYTGINEFLREVAVGRGSSAPVKGAKLPEIHKTEPWDGKDAELPKEEELEDDDETADHKHAEL